MTYLTFPHRPTPIKATEKVLDRIYEAANKGLKGDSLALAAGLTPQQFNALMVNDPLVELAAAKGKADSELTHATKLHEASLAGDAKASLAILQNVHGWVAKQKIEVEETININQILDAARGRIIEHEPVTISQQP